MSYAEAIGQSEKQGAYPHLRQALFGATANLASNSTNCLPSTRPQTERATIGDALQLLSEKIESLNETVIAAELKLSPLHISSPDQERPQNSTKKEHAQMSPVREAIDTLTDRVSELDERLAWLVRVVEI